jgi:hypothetical protein
MGGGCSGQLHGARVAVVVLDFGWEVLGDAISFR